MKRRQLGSRASRRVIFGIIIATFLFVSVAPCLGGQHALDVVLPPITWNVPGGHEPIEVWTPWAPIPTYSLFRYSMGAKFSLGTLRLKCPVKVTLSYDTQEAVGGKRLKLHIKARPDALNDNTKTFESQFGLSLPNKLQVGFVGVTGLPDILPWFNLPIDLWELIGLIPEVGTEISTLARNLGVGMTSQAALPLGGEGTNDALYGDPRDVLVFDLRKFLTKGDPPKKPKYMAEKIWYRIPSTKRSAIVNGLKVALVLETAQAESKAIDMIANGLGLVVNAGVLKLNLEPRWRLRGQEINLLLRYDIPSRSYYNTMPITLKSASQEKVLEIPIPAFANASDQLKISVQQAEYRFKLWQAINGTLNFSSAVNIPLGMDERYITLSTARKTYNNSEGHLTNIALRGAQGAITEYKLGKLSDTSIQLYYTSPNISLKGTITVLEGETVVKTYNETAFTNAHSIIITGLKPSTAYRFRLEAKDQQGQTYQPGSALSAITEAKPASAAINPQNQVTSNSVQVIDAPGRPTVSASMSGMTVTPGQNSLSFSWQTTRNASTDVYISPMASFTQYTSAVKHKNHQVTYGYVDAVQSDRELVTSHTLTYENLNPGTTYHYIMRSWVYRSTTEAKEALFPLGYVGSATTTPPPPPPPKVKIKVSLAGGSQSVSLTSIVVTATKTSSPGKTWTIPIDSQGYSAEQTLDAGANYRFEIKNHPCLQPSHNILNLSSKASGLQPELVLNAGVGAHPGGRVLDINGNPLAGAGVLRQGTSSAEFSNSEGRYTFYNLPANTNVPLMVSKSGYLNASVTGQVNACGRFSAPEVRLRKETCTLSLRVKQQGSQQNVASAGVKLFLANGSHFDLGKSNSQGVLTYTLHLANAQPTSYTLKVEPPPNTPVQPMQQPVSLEAGKDYQFTLECPVIALPVISNVQLSSGESRVFLTYTTDRAVYGGVDYSTPSQNNQSLAYGTLRGTQHQKAISATASGTYRIRAKVKDEFNREVLSTYQDWYYRTPQDWNLQATQVTHNSATISWSAYPAVPAFHHYKLQVSPGGGTVDITNRTNTTRAFTGLPPGKAITVYIAAWDSANRLLTWQTGTLTFNTKKAPPTITQFEVSPQTVGRGQKATIGLSARGDGGIREMKIFDQQNPSQPLVQKNFPDLMSATMSHDVTYQTPGAHLFEAKVRDAQGYETVQSGLRLEVTATQQPVLRLSNNYPKLTLGQPANITAKVENLIAATPTTLEVDWGDGQMQNIHPFLAGQERQISHTYQSTGSFQVKARAFIEIAGNRVYSEYKFGKPEVSAVPPQMSLTASGTHNRKTLQIKVVKGTNQVGSWELDFGDGSSKQSGKGEVDRGLEHYYPPYPAQIANQTGNKEGRAYQAKLTVVDSQKQTYVKQLTVRVPPGSTDSPGHMDSLGQTGSSGKTETKRGDQTKKEQSVDLQVKKLIAPRQLTVGSQAELKVSLKEARGQEVPACQLALYLDGQEKLRQKVDLLKGRLTSATLAFTPVKEGTLKIKVELTPPANFSDPAAKNNYKEITRRVKPALEKQAEEGKNGEQKEQLKSKAETGADLILSVTPPKGMIKAGRKVRLLALVENHSSQQMQDVRVLLQVDGRAAGEKRLKIKPNAKARAALSFPAGEPGVRRLRVEVESPQGFTDAQPANNVWEGELTVQGKAAKKKEGDTTLKDKSVNLSLRAKRVPREIATGEAQKIQLEARNSSTQALSGCKTQLWANGRMLEEKSLDLPAKGKAATELTFKPEETGLIERWSPFLGQFGGGIKVDMTSHVHAAFAMCLKYASSGVM